MDDNRILQLRDNARAELMQINDVETGIKYLNKVKAIEAWAKAEKKSGEVQNIIAEQKIRTQRILGKLIKEGQEAGEIAKQSENQSNLMQDGNKVKKNLSEIGITAKQSSTFQKIAEIPDPDFEFILNEQKPEYADDINELTTSGFLRFAEAMKNGIAVFDIFCLNYKKFYLRVKRMFPAVEEKVNPPSDLKTLSEISDLYAKYVRLQLNPGIELSDFDSRLRFIAVIVKMLDPLFEIDDSPIRKGLASKLGEVLGCERTVISHLYKNVKNYMHIYTSFRDEVNYFYRKMAEIENI